MANGDPPYYWLNTYQQQAPIYYGVPADNRMYGTCGIQGSIIQGTYAPYFPTQEQVLQQMQQFYYSPQVLQQYRPNDKAVAILESLGYEFDVAQDTWILKEKFPIYDPFEHAPEWNCYDH